MSQVAVLSPLTEGYSFGQQYQLVDANNATLVLRDANGRLHTRTDMMSVYGAVNFGHLNPEIKPFAHMTADIAACFYPESASRFAGWLLNRLELPAHQVLFQVGGSLAVSAALAVAQHVRPGRIVALEGAFHGLGVDSLAASTVGRGRIFQECPLSAHMDRLVQRLPVGSGPPDWSGVSALIFEPVQGANGYIPLPADWLTRIVSSAAAAGVVTIADEVQAGYYRHGHLSVTRALGLAPDILVFSKSMTNGLYPMSAVVYPAAFNVRLPLDTYWAHTFQTSAIGCAAAWAVAEYLDSAPIATLTAGVQRILADAASSLARIPGVCDVHVPGPSLSFGLQERVSGELVAMCETRGVLVFGGGQARTRVRIAPPVTIPPGQLVAALEQVIDATTAFATSAFTVVAGSSEEREMTYEKFVSDVMAYLVSRKPQLNSVRLTPDASLWELGYIDSLSTVELILFVEELIGREVSLENSDVRSLGTIRSIYETHVSGAAPAQGVA